MMHMLNGTVQSLPVLRKIDTGYVLNDEDYEVLLHNNETEGELNVGDVVEVFLYNDRNNQIVATTKIPSVQMDTYGWAVVVEIVPKLGVFVHVGINKDMLVSIDDLPIYTEVWPQVGDQLYVTLGLDQEDRLLAIPATESIFMDMREIPTDDLFNTSVTGRVYHTSREGAAIFTEDGYRGFIHHTEREKEPRLGGLVTGRVIEVKDDGTLNISLMPLKQERIDDDAVAILSELKKNDGVIPFSDKSNPDDIRKTFGFSKSAFKRAVGRLMRERQVEQRDGKTYLIHK